MTACISTLVFAGALVLMFGSAQGAPPTAASISDYAQCANGKPPSTALGCPDGWINGILNTNNSHYAENQNTPQRALLDLPANGSLTDRTITITYLARKGVHHAYDSLGQWNVTQTAADRCQGINPASSCPSGPESTFTIPSDTTVVADTGAGSATSLHELPAAQRYMSMFGGEITDVSQPVHDNAAGPGDDYASVQVTYDVTSLPKKVQLLFGGHLALGPGSSGWGSGLGASDVSGGPYHIRVTEVDGGAIGNRDNQIMSNAIQPVNTSVVTQLCRYDTTAQACASSNPTPGLAITVLPGSSVQDKATVIPATATGTVDFKYYSSLDNCNSNVSGSSAGTGKTLNASGEAFSDVVAFPSTGTFYWRAFFNATGTSVSSSSACDEILTVSKANPTLASAPRLIPQDDATLSGIAAGGTTQATLLFELFPPSDASCAGSPVFSQSVNVNGDGTYTTTNSGAANNTPTSFRLTSASASGTYKWKVTYSGDEANNVKTKSCGSEAFVFNGITDSAAS
jgi:hypothetical protein